MTSGFFLMFLLSMASCSNDDDGRTPDPAPDTGTFHFGADLSYVNQILDHGGIFREDGTQKDPYRIFEEQGTNVVRLRLWHSPSWTKEVYGDAGEKLYNDLKDVELAISKSNALGIKVLLDFHYSDTWADPGKQHIPAAWRNISSIEDLEDSVYNYTYNTLSYLKTKGLLPAFVQIGNETNCGMLYTDALQAFPLTNVCEGNWANMGRLVNAGIRAARDIVKNETEKIGVILHVADPKNVEWWFENMATKGAVSDFDIIGFSYYPLWHTTVPLNQISEKVAAFRSRFKKDVWILETAYPWTTGSADSYNNHFGDASPLTGYPFTEQGQHDFMVSLVQEVMDGGGNGVIYWEPAWITSGVRDLWGTGSSWENNTFFDFTGNRHKGIEYMKFKY